MHRLAALIPPPRLAPYEDACEGTSVPPIEVYRWAAQVALAVFDDLATLEVTMRSAMATHLTAAYGVTWYTRTDLLDDDTLKLIDQAWKIGKLGRLTTTPDVVQGKLVATLMFGFWVKILGRGGFYGNRPNRQRRIYDTLLWKPALRGAFPNVGDVDRARVETSARRVQSLRNRIAHHEHIVWGVPLAGEKDQGGATIRLSLSDAHEELLNLAGYVSHDLRGWLEAHSQVKARIAECPIADRSKFLL